jgi:hypothetical protein
MQQSRKGPSFCRQAHRDAKVLEGLRRNRDGEEERTVVVLGERDDALHLGCALEDGDCLLGGVSDDERSGGGGTPGACDEAERVERAGRGGRNGEDGGGWRSGGEEEGLRGHGGGDQRWGRGCWRWLGWGLVLIR